VTRVVHGRSLSDGIARLLLDLWFHAGMLTNQTSRSV
jgi:hypothetical protein